VNETYEVNVTDYSPCLKNYTINGTFVFNESDGKYWAVFDNSSYPVECVNVYSVNRTNDTCEFRTECPSGWHLEERWRKAWVPIWDWKVRRGEKGKHNFAKLFKHIDKTVKKIDEESVLRFRICGNYEFSKTVNGWGVSIDHIPYFLGNEYTSFTWWNASWQYRRNITITEQSGNTLTDYQVFINLTYDSDMQPNGEDIRFTWYNESSGEEVEIPYWFEKVVSSSYFEAWIKVPEIPASSSVTVYMYYGNSTPVSSESNGTAVFTIFENPPKQENWNVYTVGSASATWYSDRVRLSATNDPNYVTIVYKHAVDMSEDDWVLEVKVLSIQNSNYGHSGYGIRDTQTGTPRYGWDYNVYDYKGGGIHSEGENPSTITANYIYYFFRGTNRIKPVIYSTTSWWIGGYYQNSTARPGAANNTITEMIGVPDGDYYIFAFDYYEYGSGTDTQDFYSFILRKYTDPEPTYSIGAEETANEPPLKPYNLVEPTDPSTYSYTATYTFKAYITDPDGADDISTVLFESNFSGSLTNYTVSNYIDINSTTREYNITFNSLPAGYYVYRWWVSDSQNVWSVSDQQDFTVNKAKPILILSNGTYPNDFVSAWDFEEVPAGFTDMV